MQDAGSAFAILGNGEKTLVAAHKIYLLTQHAHHRDVTFSKYESLTMAFRDLQTTAHTAKPDLPRRYARPAERRQAKLASRQRHQALAQALSSPLTLQPPPPRPDVEDLHPQTPHIASPLPSRDSLHSHLRVLLQQFDGSPSERAAERRAHGTRITQENDCTSPAVAITDLVLALIDQASSCLTDGPEFCPKISHPAAVSK